MNLVEERLQILGALGYERGQRPGRDRRADPVRQQLGGAGVGQVLEADEVQAQRPHPRPVLRRRDDRGRERSGRLVPARAAPPPRAMLTDRQADLGQIEHLTRVISDVRRAAEIRVAARADRRGMIDDLIRDDGLRQMPTRMALLAARPAPRRPPQTLRRRLRQTI
ncbi:MAG: hypothetical protein QOJ85_398 [Solirubrobacteraceae bacterium]|nr:hypothetical protein [Solirubrobacteraceae bacterium]